MSTPELRTFLEFTDKEASPFYCADGRTARETWVAVWEAMRRTLAEIAYRQRDGTLEITPSALVEWHRRIFISTFPDDAGRVRGWFATGEPEHVHYGIDVGTTKTRVIQQHRGAHPNRIAERLDEVFAQYREAVELLAANQPVAVRDALLPPTRLYARVLRVHPFIDGNLRAAFVVLQSSLLELGLPALEFADLAAHDEALGFALRTDGKQSYEPLRELSSSIFQEAGVGGR